MGKEEPLLLQKLVKERKACKQMILVQAYCLWDTMIT